MFKRNHKVLFICKNSKGLDDGVYSHAPISSGLANSAKFVVDMLNKLPHHMVEAKLVSVVDNNCIDKEVSLFKPNTVIIEAFWVVPEKFEVLKRLHPTVKWIIRVHSEVPFLAMEGSAMDWTGRYLKETDVSISFNSDKTYSDMVTYAKGLGEGYSNRILYLPNFYPVHFHMPMEKYPSNVVKIGCFGAVRPLKNHLTQAMAAIVFADNIGKQLEFHINGTRVEQSGNTVLKNLRKMFGHSDKHTLVEHGWMDHTHFINVLRSMDYGVQVSMTESFNIVAADMVAANVPVVVSSEIRWLPWWTKAETTSIDSIVARLHLVRLGKYFGLEKINNRLLDSFSEKTRMVWQNAVFNNVI